MSFKDKTILITGASSGIGAAAAFHFAKEGASLALVGRNVERFEKIIAQINEINIDCEPLMILADISVDAERIVSETIDKYGKLDVLINNAGFAIPGTIEDTRIEDFDSVMATNVRGTFILTQLCVPHLIESTGNIINISSVCGIRPFTNLLAYCMSKAALDQFTRCVANELATKGVRVNSVNPGVFKTNFHDCFGFDKDSPEYNDAMNNLLTMHPMGRLGELDECVGAIAYLAHENASFVTGITLSCDGGASVKSPC